MGGYCNCPIGSKYADMRAANDRKEPYNVSLWCIGNEMDGEWQLGHMPAREYAIKAKMAIKMMKDTSPLVKLLYVAVVTF